MKKIILFLSILLLPFNVKALSVDSSSLTLEKGAYEKVALYANSDEDITSAVLTVVYTSYDVTASFTSNSDYYAIDGSTYKVNFDEPQSGKILLGYVVINVKRYPDGTSGSITVYGAKGYTASDDVVSFDAQSLYVTIGEKQEVKEVDKNLLDKIDSKIVNINLQKDVFEYNITVDDISKLDLTPVAKDKATEVTTKKSDNKVVITAKNGDVTQEYVINIKVKAKQEEVITVDKTEFKADNGYKGKWILISMVFACMLVFGLYLNKKMN